MKPFNLEAALRGEKVVTRQGEEVIHIMQVPKCPSGLRSIIAVTKTDWFAYLENGRMGTACTPDDLFMATEEKELCVICITFLPEWNSKYCSDCNNLSNRLLIFELAKRIKALEEKVK